MVGLSQNSHALCTDADFQTLPTTEPHFTVRDEQTISLPSSEKTDWAVGSNKYECPDNHYAAGFSKNFFGVNGLLCVLHELPLSQNCKALQFSHGDQRESNKGGDFAIGSYKGQCADGEYMKGIAQRLGTASAILCCSG
jgi:hypothetical protein